MIEYGVEESQAPAFSMFAAQFRGKIHPENSISYANTVINVAKLIRFCTPSHCWKPENFWKASTAVSQRWSAAALYNDFETGFFCTSK